MILDSKVYLPDVIFLSLIPVFHANLVLPIYGGFLAVVITLTIPGVSVEFLYKYKIFTSYKGLHYLSSSKYDCIYYTNPEN